MFPCQLTVSFYLLLTKWCFWVVSAFSFGIIFDLMLWKLKTFDLTTLILLLTLLNHHCSGKWHRLLYSCLPISLCVGLLWFPHTHSQVIATTTSYAFFFKCLTFARLMHFTAVSTFLLGHVFISLWLVFVIITLVFSSILNSFIFFSVKSYMWRKKKIYLS